MTRRLRPYLWKAIKAALDRAGIDAFVRRPYYSYVPQIPDYFGRSAHKLIDIRDLPSFGELARRTIQHGKTLLYYDRLFTIYQSLANLRRPIGVVSNIDLAEVWVYKGGSSYFIASAANDLGLKPFTLHCFDTFEGHRPEDITIGVDIETVHYVGQFGDTDIESVREYLGRFENVKLYKGRFQDTCFEVADRAFHFVHLDVDIYEPTLSALTFFDRRLIPGATMIVDDYAFTTCPGAKKAVDEFLSTRGDYYALQLLSGECVLVKQGQRTTTK